MNTPEEIASLTLRLLTELRDGVRGLAARLDENTARLDENTARLDDYNLRLERMDGRLSQRIDGVQHGLDRLAHVTDGLSQRLDNMLMGAHREEHLELRQRIDHLEHDLIPKP